MYLSLKRTLFILSIAAIMVALLLTPALAAVNEIVWKKFFTDEQRTTSKMAVDRNGNIVIAGFAGDGLAFIQKLSGGGRSLWYRQFDLSSSGLTDSSLDVAVDSDGYIYVAGVTNEVTYDFEEITSGDETIFVRHSTIVTHPFVKKYGPKGGHHWTRKFAQDLTIRGVDVGPGGNIYVAGEALVDRPNTTNSIVVPDGFIRKLNSAGKIYWTRRFSLNSFEAGTNVGDVAVGPGGGVYIVGTDNSRARDQDTMFLRKYSPRGGVYWTRRVSRRDPYTPMGLHIAVDRAGEVTAVTWDFAVKYSHRGKRLWTRLFSWDDALGVAVDRDRSVYVVGQGSSGDKAYVRKYDADGTRLWLRYFVNGGARAAATDSDNNLFVAGWRSLENYPDFLVKFRRPSGLCQNTLSSQCY